MSSSVSSVDRFASIRSVYSESTWNAIQQSKVLVVGAGGIGCELLKNLVLSGFHDLTVLDLDTIDVSNLNRQFLFRRPHVGQSKAVVARESVLKFQPTAKIVAIHGNIKDHTYDHDWFSQFTLVMNALDNLEARRHVNRLCLSAGRTLLESGTQGYAGQSSVIRGGTTECFECAPIATPKTFAVCTIRNTPDKPVHTVVWAKALYAALFGPPDDGGLMADAKMDLKDGIEQAKEVQLAWEEGKANPFALESYSVFAREVFMKLYTTEIEKQCEVKERWKERAPPTPLNLEQLLQERSDAAAASITGTDISERTYRQRDHEVFSTAENALFFLRIVDLTLSTRSEELGDLTFDKDDAFAMDFVSLASNLRMVNFGITPLSRFALKGIAGNIVHAIATTNAIAAGLMVNDAIKILSGHIEQCKTMWITRRAPGLLTSQTLNPPNPKCFVCSQQTLELSLDTDKWTLKRLYDEVLRKKLSMNEPSIDVMNRDNFIGTEDDHSEDNPEYLQLPLSSQGVRVDHSAILAIEDQSQKMSVQLRVRHTADWAEEDPDQFTITGDLNLAKGDDDEANGAEEEQKQPTSTPSAASAIPQPPATIVDDDDDVLMSDGPSTSSAPTANTIAGSKRKQPDSITTEESDSMTSAPKKAKVDATPKENEDGVIELD